MTETRTVQLPIARGQVQRQRVITIPLASPCTLDDLASAIERAKEFGADGGNRNWQFQAGNGVVQALIVVELDTAVIT